MLSGEEFTDQFTLSGGLVSQDQYIGAAELDAGPAGLDGIMGFVARRISGRRSTENSPQDWT